MRWKRWIGCFALLGLITGCHSGTAGSTPTTVQLNITAITIAVGGTVSFEASVNTTGTDVSVIWQVNSVTGGSAKFGTIDTNGNYTAPTSVPNPNTVTVTAISNAVMTASASATVTIDSGVRVAVAPTTVNMGTGETIPFTATVTGTPTLTVTWSVCQTNTSGSTLTTPCPADTTGALGKIDNTGNYSAPPTVPTGNPVTIQAVSTVDANQFGSATITLVAAVDPTVSSVYPVTVGQGSAFVDIFLQGTNFLTTTQVIVNGTTINNMVASSGGVLRARLADTFMSSSPTTLQIQVARKNNGTPVTCSPTPSSCQIAVVPVRPAVVASSPASLNAGLSTPSVTIDGGYFGTSATIPSVGVNFDGLTTSTSNFTDRQVAATLTDLEDTVPGLHQFTVTNSSVTQPPVLPQQTAAVNFAIQPSVTPVVQSTPVPVGTGPDAIAINTATGIAVVANFGSNNITLVDMTGAFPTPVPGGTVAVDPGPTGVAVDNVRNLAVVVSNTAKTISVVNLATQAVSKLGTFIPASPFSVGVNPITGLALVAYQNTDIAAIVDLKQTPPQFVGTVTASTGSAPRVAIMPTLNWGMITPGGEGVFSIVDLGREKVFSITPTGAMRVSSTSTVTITTTLPHGFIIGDAVLISGITDSSFDGLFNVTSVPTSTSFTYTQTGADSSSGGGTVFSSDPLATVSFGQNVTGIAVNPESKQAIVADPTNQSPLEIMSLLDQSVTTVLNVVPPALLEAGTVAVAVSPFTDVAVAVNPKSANPITILDPRVDPNHQPVVTAELPLNGVVSHENPFNPVDVAIDPGTDTALVVDQANNNLIVVTLNGNGLPINTPQLQSVVLPLSDNSVGTDMTLTSTLPLPLTLIGKGFKPGMVARVDGQPIATVGAITDRVMNVTVPADLLGSARRFAVDVVNPGVSGVISNVEGFSVVQAVDLTSPSCPTPSPSAVAIDDVRNLALVTEASCNSLALVNLATGAVTQTLPVGSNPQGVATMPANGVAVVTNSGDNTAQILNIADTTQTPVTLSVGIQPIGVAISPLDGTTIVTNFNGNSNNVSTFFVTQGANATPQTTLVGSGPVAVAVDPVGLTACVANSSSSSITLLDISQSPPVIITNLSGPDQPQGVVFDPINQAYIITSSLGNSLFFVKPSTQQIQAARIGINPTSIAYNFQTSTIVTVNSISNTVSVMDINDAHVKANMGLTGSLLGAVAIHPLTNLIYIADAAKSRLLIVPLSY